MDMGNKKGSTGGMYHPSGELQGDESGMSNKGTGTGLNGDTYGADIGPSATNRIGSMNANSDPWQLAEEDDQDADKVDKMPAGDMEKMYN